MIVKQLGSCANNVNKNNPNLKTNLLNTKLQNEYNISSRTADSIIKTVQGRINSIRELKKTEIKQKNID